jgi:hypothetical protein
MKKQFPEAIVKLGGFGRFSPLLALYLLLLGYPGKLRFGLARYLIQRPLPVREERVWDYRVSSVPI